MERKIEFIDLKSKLYDIHESLQFKYPVIFVIIHSIFMIIIGSIIVFLEIFIGLHSNFLTQIVDSTVSNGVTMGALYILMATLELLLSNFYF